LLAVRVVADSFGAVTEVALTTLAGAVALELANAVLPA